MYLDISSNQGKIDWESVAANKDINGIILRSTTQNGNLDVRTMENYNGILQHFDKDALKELSAYKFTYARDYIEARKECRICVSELLKKGIYFDGLYLDIEKHSGRDYTGQEANAVIYGYMDELGAMGQHNKLALYFNYNYLKHIINPVWWGLPIWLARYNKTMGDTFGANIVLWQYTSSGTIDGITGKVDLSKGV